MKTKNKIAYYMKAAIVITVALAFIIPTSTVIANPISEDTQTLNKCMVSQTAIHKSMPVVAGFGTDVLISSDNPGEADEVPKAVMSPDGTIVVTYEKQIDALTRRVPVVYSKDQGQSWIEQFEFDSTGLQGSDYIQSVDIKYSIAAGQFFWSGIDPFADMYNEETYWIPGDIENATEAMGWGQSSQGGTDYTEGAITNVGQWAVGFAIETNYGITGAPGLAYNYWDGTNDPMAPVDYDPSWAAGYYYDGQSVLHTAEASQPEMATGNNMYMVMQSFNGAYSNISFKATVTDLNPASPTFLFTSGGGPSGMDKYADIEVWPIKQFYVAVDATDPDVGAKGDIVAVVYAQDGAVKCSVSEDAGLNWTVNTVAAAGGYPAVYVAEGKIYCAYVNGGNLYFTFSTDNGATWGTPVQLNDQTGSVAAIPGTVDIGAAGFVWTDTRNAENDIYYEYMLMEPPAEVPELTIVAVTGGIGAKATIGNVGNAAATNVAWTIEVTGGILGKINVQGEGTIASLAADAEDSSAKTKMILGLGAISVKVTATCDEGSTASVTKAGKQLLIFTSIPAA